MNKTRWSDVTEAELAATGKVSRGSVRPPARGARLAQDVPVVKPSKYRNVKTIVGGEKFDSRREADYWIALMARERAGEITDLRRQVRFALCAPIIVNGKEEVGGARVTVAEYVADFVYLDARTALRRVVDAKGKATQMYALKKKWLELQDGIVIEEV